ncbi:MAG: hypothetical protein ABL892_08880 [Thiobacillaceae bacterium]
MLQRLVCAFFLGLFSLSAAAIAPYIGGDKLQAGEWSAVAGQVEAKLRGAGFQVIGRYLPKGQSSFGVVVVTDEAMLAKVHALGGTNILAAPIRVGVGADGSVAYMNPDYWYRAYFRSAFSQVEDTARAVQSLLAKTLGAGPGMGGDESAASLPKYRYMIGMERFDDPQNVLAKYASFDDAVKTVRDNLAKGLAGVSKVYEIVMPEKKVAVFGVAMNSPVNGDTVLLTKIGVQDRSAALPYEMFVVNNEVRALFARYRLALAFPDLGMGQFMRIVSAPGEIRSTLLTVAGGSTE